MPEGPIDSEQLALDAPVEVAEADDEPTTVEFTPPEDPSGVLFRSGRWDRRGVLAALSASLIAHGVLLGAAVAVMHQHRNRPPVGRTIRGDQGGDGGAYYAAGDVETPSIASAPLPVISALPDPAETALPTPVAEHPMQDVSSSLPSDSSPPVLEAVASASETTPFGIPAVGDHGVMLPRGAGGGATTMPSSSGNVATEVAHTYTSPRVAGGSGHGATVGVRGDPDGLDNRGLPIPEYPADSRRRNEQGLVTLEVEVRIDGTVGEIRLHTDSGYPRLNNAAIAAAKKAAFEPGTRDGRPIGAHLVIPYRFVLR